MHPPGMSFIDHVENIDSLNYYVELPNADTFHHAM